jgi:hypothetical protein
MSGRCWVAGQEHEFVVEADRRARIALPHLDERRLGARRQHLQTLARRIGRDVLGLGDAIQELHGRVIGVLRVQRDPVPLVAAQ